MTTGERIEHEVKDDKLFLSIGSPVMKGFLGIWILFLLSRKNMNGYEILKHISDATSHCWEPKTGSLYPALHKMEDKKFIKSTKQGSRNQIVYSLTPKGKNAIAELRKSVYNSYTKHKFRNMFESLIWPKESEEMKEEMNKLHEKIFELRDSKSSEREKMKKIRSAKAFLK